MTASTPRILGFYRGRRVQITDTYNMPDGERAHLRFLDTEADETAVVPARLVSQVRVAR